MLQLRIGNDGALVYGNGFLQDPAKLLLFLGMTGETVQDVDQGGLRGVISCIEHDGSFGDELIEFHRHRVLLGWVDRKVRE